MPNRKIDVLQYDLQLDVFQEDEFISENAKIKLIVLEENQRKIELDFNDNFNINSVKFNGDKASYEYENDKIVLYRNDTSDDTLNIEINFEGKPQNLGMGSFSMESKNGQNFLSTLNEPIFASTWFPCNDTPSDKATTKISITNDSNIVSLSNGKIIDIVTEGDRRTYVWESEYPIATYLISIYSGEYQKINQVYYSNKDTMDIDYYVMEDKLDNAKKDFANHPDYLKVFSELFGEYPFIKEKYAVAEILWKQGAMESQTITGIGGNFISGMNFNESILIHEVAHHWWGNSVTLKNWNNIWLNEGFATYAEPLYFEKTRGQKALISTMYSFKQRINFRDNQTLYNPGTDIFSSTIYNKGAWVLHMLRKEIGDSLFFSGLKNYYNKFKYSNASTEDLKQVFEKTSNKKLNKFFAQWVYEGTGFMELDINFDEQVTSIDSVVLSIEIRQTQSGYSNYHFPLDIELEDSSGAIFNYTPYIKSDTTLKYIISNRIKDITFDKNNWLLVNIE
ncbi:MAG: M1 family metallopeptidase [Melioribacteraceae bacterium]|nr:M1 family metallopeptidase [Melioribacteraceae bacterium]